MARSKSYLFNSEDNHEHQIVLLFQYDVELLPPANEVCEGYVFTRVCHSVHGGRGGLPHSMLGYTHPNLYQRQTPPSPGPEAGTPTGPEAGTPLVQCMLGDTGNKRLVRILLECNLV